MKKLVAIAITAAVAFTGACAKKDKSAKDLPPAAGSGAKPLPELPDVKPAGSGAGAAGGSAVTADAAVTGTLQPREEV
jgi:hypothetical protein